MQTRRKRLGELLLEAGAITEDQLRKALEIQRASGRRLGDILIQEKIITEAELVKVLEEQLGITSVDLSVYGLDPKAAQMIPESLARRHTVLPLKLEGGKLVLAMKDPLDYPAQEDVKTLTGYPVQPVIAPEKDILRAVERVFSRSVAQRAAEDFVRLYGQAAEAPEAADAGLEAAPIVRFINTVLSSAVRAGASDVHIEPGEGHMRVRLRVDGMLQENLVTGMGSHQAVVNRIKVMADLNVAERRVPQDGRASYTVDGREVDLRVSVLPTTHGEKAVIRILDKASLILEKGQLGMSERDLEIFDRLLSRPYGIILVTGPTGSGKTTTLYAMLQELNDVAKNIVTIEDPVEYNLAGITQTQVNVRAGYTFATGLRSILRQDPDIIMVGEIRDLETAEIAVRAALTGHLVLSTLHTNDAPGAVTRLLDMGVEPFLVSSSLLGVIAQRLVRRVCPACRETYAADEREKRYLGLPLQDSAVLARGRGCAACGGTGYRGRTAVFEIMEVGRRHRLLVDRRVAEEELRQLAKEQGMVTLWENCREKVLAGVTTVEEMARVTYQY